MKNIFGCLKNDIFHFVHKRGREMEAAVEATWSRDQSESQWWTFKEFNTNMLAVRNPWSHEQSF